jgi:CelD/BcsL family acetyltransferase involved in cellulose biosynthesis
LGLRLVAPPLSCEAFSSLGAVGHLRAEWDRLVAAVGAPIDMTYDWCRLWWAHYRAEREARVFLFRDEGELVGVVPMCIDRARIGPVTLRVAKIMGADFTPGLCDAAVRAPWAETVINEILERLITDDRCDAILFGPISDASGRTDAVREAAARRPELVSILRDRVITQHATIDLPDTFDAYLESLSRNQRFNLRKGWKRLRDDFEVTVETTDDLTEAPRELDAFIRMHETQWQDQGKLGHFEDWPRARRFHRALVSVMSEAGRVRFLRLRADESVIARQYSYVFGGTCQCRLAARAPGGEWEKYGPGRLSLASLFEHAIGEGVRTIDAGTGHYDYKLRLGGREHDVRTILVGANRPGPRNRARLFGLLADTLDRLYYKLWFCEVAPRLPVRNRPLSMTWIRSRV